MSKTKTPEHCKGCRILWHSANGLPWCTHFGKKAADAVGQCKLTGAKK